jgi:hypothetical protein
MKARGCKISGALCIPSRVVPVKMLASINLNDQIRVAAEEVEDVGTEGMLAAKFRACLTTSQVMPEK